MINEITKALSKGHKRRLCRLETNNRRRARAMKCVIVQPVNFILILERQSYRCCLCNEMMDPTLPGTHPHSISIEHPIALSCGGHHKPGNVYGAHLVCNLDKGSGEDTSRAAKIKRQAALTGQYARRTRAKANGTHRAIGSAGFDDRYTRKFNGVVEVRTKRSVKRAGRAHG